MAPLPTPTATKSLFLRSLESEAADDNIWGDGSRTPRSARLHGRERALRKDSRRFTLPSIQGSTSGEGDIDVNSLTPQSARIWRPNGDDSSDLSDTDTSTPTPTPLASMRRARRSTTAPFREADGQAGAGDRKDTSVDSAARAKTGGGDRRASRSCTVAIREVPRPSPPAEPKVQRRPRTRTLPASLHALAATAGEPDEEKVEVEVDDSAQIEAEDIPAEVDQWIRKSSLNRQFVSCTDRLKDKLRAARESMQTNSREGRSVKWIALPD